MQGRKGNATAAVSSELQPAQGSESDLEGEMGRGNCLQSLGNWPLLRGKQSRAHSTAEAQQPTET